MVRFFGKTAGTRTSTARKAATTEPPAPAAEPPNEAEKPTVRRRTTARPPRRDWAAEAAATPVGEPVPRPTSLASAPTEDSDETTGAPAKRRRGTRGGRGRKRPTKTTAVGAEQEEAPEPARASAAPKTIEEALVQQAQALDRFSREMVSAVARLQGAVGELQQKIDERAKAPATNPRVGIFVDVPNLVYAAERRKLQIDFGRVLDYFTRDRELVRASAYAPITDDPQAKLENQRFVQHFVGYPYRIITKPLKRFADGSMKANFDIELAIDILTMSDRLDVVVLMSGDGDFRRLVELIASRGVRVEVAAFSETASAELKAVADLYVDFGAHIEDFKILKK